MDKATHSSSSKYYVFLPPAPPFGPVAVYWYNIVILNVVVPDTSWSRISILPSLLIFTIQYPFKT
jgi:hypothetical protein